MTTYQQAGVDIALGNTLVDRIKPMAKKTRRPEVLGGIGGFSALFELPIERYKKPILVSGTDGVGTKLKLAIDANQHQGIGIDLVAMCANDLLVCGAEPLFFLDYYATGKLALETASMIIGSIAEGCLQAGMSLIGGETAEMPGLYAQDDYDLAGFAVGVVEKDKIIDGSQVKADDVLIALSSSGAHSNGFSLIRKIIQDNHIDWRTEKIADKSLIDVLLEPTRIYVKPILNVLAKLPQHAVKAMAHITGGGITENLPRVLPENLAAEIHVNSWQWPELFHFLQNKGDVSTEEMHRVFNCGVGMILCVAAPYEKEILSLLASENAWTIGKIVLRDDDSVVYQK